MSTATARRFIETYEGTSFRKGVTETVDREKGILRGVKLLGFESKNDEGRRRYLKPEASLYENVPVNLNHPGWDSDVRIHDRWGVVLTGSVVVEDDGVFGDIEYNPNHEETESILWWAENHSDQMGMSHVAFGEAEVIDNTIWLTITEVESVDLVARPATTAGFYESATEQEKDPMEFKEKFEAEVAAHLETKATLAHTKTALRADARDREGRPCEGHAGCSPQGPPDRGRPGQDQARFREGRSGLRDGRGRQGTHRECEAGQGDRREAPQRERPRGRWRRRRGPDLRGTEGGRQVRLLGPHRA